MNVQALVHVFDPSSRSNQPRRQITSNRGRVHPIPRKGASLACCHDVVAIGGDAKPRCERFLRTARQTRSCAPSSTPRKITLERSHVARSAATPDCVSYADGTRGYVNTSDTSVPRSTSLRTVLARDFRWYSPYPSPSLTPCGLESRSTRPLGVTTTLSTVDPAIRGSVRTAPRQRLEGCARHPDGLPTTSVDLGTGPGTRVARRLFAKDNRSDQRSPLHCVMCSTLTSTTRSARRAEKASAATRPIQRFNHGLRKAGATRSTC